MTMNTVVGANNSVKASPKATEAGKTRGKAPVTVSFKAADGTWDGNPGSNVTAVKIADVGSKRFREVELASIPAETRNKIVGLWLKGASKLQYRGDDGWVTVENFLKEIQKGVLKVGKKGKKPKPLTFPVDMFIEAMRITADRRTEAAKKNGTRVPIYAPRLFDDMRERLTIGTKKEQHVIMKAYEKDAVFMQAFTELKLKAAAAGGTEGVDALAAGV